MLSVQNSGKHASDHVYLPRNILSLMVAFEFSNKDFLDFL